MSAKSIQRTLIVTLGQAGAQVAGALAARLDRTPGPVGVIGFVAVLPEPAGDNETEPAGRAVLPQPFYQARLAIAPEEYGDVSRWQAALAETAAVALHHISDLAHLTALARQGLSLHRPDEVQLILIAALDGPEGYSALAAAPDLLRETVTRTLACETGLTGLLLHLAPLASAVSAAVGEGWGEGLARQFDRGCFTAGLTNEIGLSLGSAAELIERAGQFLALLIASPLELAALTDGSAFEAGWAEPVPASFGLAAIHWPGREVVTALSARRAGEALARLIAPALPQPDWARQAREAAQSLALAERVAPPLLLEQLAGLTPALPEYLAGQVPDPPWPWLLAGLPDRLDAAARAWEEAWLEAGRELKPGLESLAGRWQAAVRAWLDAKGPGHLAGSLVELEACLAAMTELLAAFAGGVEERLAEAETDLVAVERQVGKTSQSLSDSLAALPGSPLEAILAWGWQPWRWLRAWDRCRRAQAAARQLAHLLRQRLLVKRSLWLYEETLPFYRELAAGWAGVAATWSHWLQQVAAASQDPALAAWPELLEAALPAPGPWSPAMVEAWYRDIQAGEETKPADLCQPDAGSVTAAEIVSRLAGEAAEFLSPHLDVPVETALARQFPAEAELAAWLAAFVAQAAPFWQYDETALDEMARSQARLETWLVVPGGKDSPLARMVKDWPRPPVCLDHESPQELVAVSIRRGVGLCKRFT